MEDADAAFRLLCLLYGQGNLVLSAVIRIADFKLWRAGSVNPLVKELLDVNVIGFFDGLDEIGGDYVLAAIDFQVVPQAAIESILADLPAKHVQHQAALSISVVVKLAGVVKVVANDRFDE